MRALITGVTGQDGSYLAELLLSKGYEVHGIIRRVGVEDHNARLSRILHIKDRLNLHYASLESLPSLWKVVAEVEPREVYHLAGQSFVVNSFEDEHTSMLVNLNGTHNMLASCRAIVPDCAFYFAATSEMFGNSREDPQSESTPFCPRSVYAISKLGGFNLAKHYREAYGFRASSGILFNHESPRRGMEFVTRKISRYVGDLVSGRAVSGKAGGPLRLGNIRARRDWGYAPEYVEAMWRMLQQPRGDDFVVATGETHSVESFCVEAFGLCGEDWQRHVLTDPRYERPSDVENLRGSPKRALEQLGWAPVTRFKELVKLMVDADVSS